MSFVADVAIVVIFLELDNTWTAALIYFVFRLLFD